MEIFAYEECKLHYTFGWPKMKPTNSQDPPPAFDLVEIQLICKVEHLWRNLSGKKMRSCELPQISTCITMESQYFKNPEKTRLAIHDRLKSFQFPLFECKVIVDELIQLAHEHSDRLVFIKDRYVLNLGVKIDMSHRYKQINENDRNAMARTLPTKNCKICDEGIFGGSPIIKMPCKHIFHFNCMKNWLERNIGCPTCTPTNNGKSLGV
ncbi:uncharacterized protein LOC132066106 [Lycium ferocissimum]|uniref:uncharacterized protein LOC132066106 n=1 Tax=Lycium ferocissimum TaxID=112874 RepID=UPI002814C25D|nr:uncharacterized protein LOC132066106 [Lycium ferocissimum]